MMKTTLISLVAIATVSFATNADSECGIASVYWEGTQTANGERFRPEGISAAHKTLPFGSRVSVRDSNSGRSILVRINDRGPFISGRIIDLSRGAARALGMDGLAQVCIETVEIGARNAKPLSHRLQHNAEKKVKVCRKRRRHHRRKRWNCRISRAGQPVQRQYAPGVKHSKHFAEVESFTKRRRAFAQISSTPTDVVVASKPKEEAKPVFHELLGAAALVTMISPTLFTDPPPAPKMTPQKHALLQKVVDVRFEKKLESLEEKIDRIMGKLDTKATSPAPSAPNPPPALPQSEPKEEPQPLSLPEQPKRIDAGLKQRIDMLAKKIKVDAAMQAEPTDTGLPAAPPPDNLKPDDQSKKFWINPEDERRSAEPSPSPKPVTPQPSQTNESALTLSQKLMMKKLVEQLDSIERRLQHLETPPKAAPVAPAYEPQPRSTPQPPKEQKIPRDVEAKIQQAPASMQPDIRRRYREHMKKPCFFTDEEGEKIPCTMRSLLQ